MFFKLKMIVCNNMNAIKLIPAFVLIVSFLLFPSLVNAANLDEWNIDISIKEDRSALWTVTLDYEENIEKSDYFILSDVTNVGVFADSLPIECEVSKKVGTTIVCENLDAKKIVYRFRTNDNVDSFQNLFIFNYRFSVTQLTDRFELTVKLPLGSAVVEKEKIEGTGLNRFEPIWGREGSDGRIIFVEWIVNDPRLGETFDASIVYENIIIIDQPQFLYAVAIIIIAIIIVAIYFFKFRSTIEDMLPVLTDNERKVMEIILKEKTVDQRKIVKDTDFSKAKVSRIIHDLIKRGLIEKKPKGRTNIIRLKSKKKLRKIGEKEKEKT